MRTINIIIKIILWCSLFRLFFLEIIVLHIIRLIVLNNLRTMSSSLCALPFPSRLNLETGCPVEGVLCELVSTSLAEITYWSIEVEQCASEIDTLAGSTFSLVRRRFTLWFLMTCSRSWTVTSHKPLYCSSKHPGCRISMCRRRLYLQIASASVGQSGHLRGVLVHGDVFECVPAFRSWIFIRFLHVDWLRSIFSILPGCRTILHAPLARRQNPQGARCESSGSVNVCAALWRSNFGPVGIATSGHRSQRRSARTIRAPPSCSHRKQIPPKWWK